MSHVLETERVLSPDKLIMWTKIKNFLCEEDATTAVEYCVMLAVLLLTIVGVTSAGGGSSKWWQDIVNDFTSFGM